jgi:hypothetical protein
MNKKQKIIMWVGIAIFVFIGLTTETSFGMRGVYWTDYGPLIARLVSTAVVTLGLIVTFKDKKDNKTKDEQKE